MLAASPLAATQATGTPDQVGQWSAPISWPEVAVHMALQPTGTVLVFDGFGAAPNSERLWDPSSGAFVPVPYGRNLFCSGHVGLADGRTLILGGHINANDGLADTTIFDSKTNTWFRGPDMTVGRWYPTATLLPDGRSFVISGDNIVQDRPGATPPFSDASVNSLPEVYNPKANSWTDLPGARLTTPLYPFMFVLSDGRLLDAGPDTTTRVLTPGSWTWSTIGTSPFDGMSAVMYRPDKIMKSGSWADPDWNGGAHPIYQSTNRTAVLDMTQGSPSWRETAPMHFGRAYHNLTLLPDGTVFASGGTSQSDGVDITKSVLPAEIWNPDTETWTRSPRSRTAGSTTRRRCSSPTAACSWPAAVSCRGRAPSTRRMPRSTRRRTCSRARGRRSRPRRRHRFSWEARSRSRRRTPRRSRRSRSSEPRP